VTVAVKSRVTAFLSVEGFKLDVNVVTVFGLFTVWVRDSHPDDDVFLGCVHAAETHVVVTGENTINRFQIVSPFVGCQQHCR
jgi:hypothetical protein